MTTALISHSAIYVAIVAIAVWDMRRDRRLGAARGPSLSTRFVEAISLGAVGIVAAAFWCWDPELVEHAELVRPAVVRAYFIAVALVGLALIAVMLASFYRMWLGTLLLMAVLFAVSQWAFTRDRLWLTWVPEAERHRVAYLTLGDDVPYDGVQLHINGVHLGELPLTVTLDEFRRRVPHWTEPPDGLDEQALSWPSQYQQDRDRPWGAIAIDVPNTRYSESWSPRSAPRQTYYAQFELAGEWVGSEGGDSGGGDGSATPHMIRMDRDFNVRFPKYDAQVRAHIARAQQADYGVDDDWIAQMQQFGQRGWRLLAEMAEQDPQCHRVRHAWAARHYQLDQVKDADAAWAVLEQIAAEAEQRGLYDTASIAGAAVDLLVERIDPDQLAEAAIEALPSTQRGSSSYRPFYDDGGQLVRFAGRLPDRPRLAGRYRPFRVYVLAHAVWKLDARLDALDDTAANIIERRVLDALVYGSRDLTREPSRSFRIAIAMGWPDAYELLSRHDWSRRVINSRTDPLAMSVDNEVYVNVWLYRLLSLDTPEGQQFRASHNRRLLETAETIVKAAEYEVNFDRLGFLFLDPQLGNLSPGMAFWPRFMELTRVLGVRDGFEHLDARVSYLVRLEPLATTAMYTEALLATRGTYFGQIPRDLERLQPQKRRQVLEAWLAACQDLRDNPPRSPEPWMKREMLERQHGLIWWIQHHLQQLERQP